MSTLQNTPQHRDRIRTRNTRILALSTLIAIGLGLLILMPTGHRTTPPARGTIAAPATPPTQTAAPDGCFRDPATHALTCYHAAATPIATPARPGTFRDPVTHKLLRLPAPRKRAGHLPPNHSRGRIIP